MSPVAAAPVARHSPKTANTGMIAHISTAPANPKATPAQTSRLRLLVSRSPSKIATAPIRQNSVSQGSTSTVCEAATLFG